MLVTITKAKFAHLGHAGAVTIKSFSIAVSPTR